MPDSASSQSTQSSASRMSSETYLNHPTFGLLYRVCVVDDSRELFATLYAQRLFFVVTTATQGIQFEPIGRSDSRILVEGRLRELRRSGQYGEHGKLQVVHQQTFQ